jgi:hypothetical protein
MDDGKKIMAEFEDNWDKEIEKLTEEQIDNYYKKGITDGLSDEQRAYLYFKPDAELYAEVMGAEDFTDNLLENQVAKQDMPDSSSIKAESMATNAMEMDEEDFMKQIETKNNIPKGSISKLGLALDPIAEGLEFALKGIGLGSIANWWVKAEAANFLAGLIRGAGAASGVVQLGQSQALMGEQFTADADAIKNAFAQNLSSQMKLSPSLWMENKYAESDLGKGKTPSQQGYEAVKNALKLGK